MYSHNVVKAKRSCSRTHRSQKIWHMKSQVKLRNGRLGMKKFILLIVTMLVFIASYSDLALAAPDRRNNVVGADGTVYQYGYDITNPGKPCCNNSCYNLYVVTYGCMTLQYGDTPCGQKAPSCPSCINSGCCRCNSCH
jgi:hypothetical protein